MDSFPSLIDSDMNIPHRQSTGVGTSDLHPSYNPIMSFSRRDSSNPSLFHYHPYSPHEATIGFVAVDPVQGSHDHTGRPEVSNPPPLQLGEVSSSDLNGGHYVHWGKSPIVSSHHSPLHIGTIPLVTNTPLNKKSPIGTPLGIIGPNPTQLVIGKVPTQGYHPRGQTGHNHYYIQWKLRSNIMTV